MTMCEIYGQEGLAFRGDEDETDSNFKQIMNMKAEDDPALEKWLQ